MGLFRALMHRHTEGKGQGDQARDTDRGKARWTRVQLERLPLRPSCILQTAADRFPKMPAVASGPVAP